MATVTEGINTRQYALSLIADQRPRVNASVSGQVHEEHLLLFVNHEGRLTYCDGANMEVLGADVTRLLGKPLKEVLVSAPELCTAVQKVLDEGITTEGWVTWRGLLWRYRCYPVRGEDDRILSVVVYIGAMKEAQPLVRQRDIVVELTAALRNVDASKDLPQEVVSYLARTFAARTVMLIGRQAFNGQHLVVQSAAGWWEKWNGYLIDDVPDSSLVAQIHKALDEQSPCTNVKIANSGELSSLIVSSVPLMLNDHAQGVICVGMDRSLSHDDQQVLMVAGELVASALNRATQFDQTRQNLQRLSILHDMDKAITSTLDLRVALNVLLDQLVTHVGVDAALVYLVKPEATALEYAAGRGLQISNYPRIFVPLGRGLLGQVVLSRNCVLIPDLKQVKVSLESIDQPLADEFATYVGVPLVVKGQVKGVLELFQLRKFLPSDDWLEFIETLAAQAAMAVDNAEMFLDLQKANAELSLAYDATLEGWVRALDLRDRETEGHTKRVTEITLKLAETLGVNAEELVHIRRGALLHDIGKIAIPDYVLNKSGPLDEEEWALMRKHPTYAYELLSPITFLRPALDIPIAHHERWDGSGYPKGIAGEQIPLAARIFAVVDVWDALRSDRPYRSAWSDGKARAYIIENAGKQFDPEVVSIFLKMI